MTSPGAVVGEGPISASRVNLLVITGEVADAQDFVARHFPGRECVLLSKRELREAGWVGQLRSFRKMEGEALVFFLRSLSDLQEPQLTVCSSFLHRCGQTILADCSGHISTYGRLAWVRMLPKALVSGFIDVFVMVSAWLSLQLVRTRTEPIQIFEQNSADLDIAYLYPYPLDSAIAGGALSHVKGFLSGVAAFGARCEIFSGRSLPDDNFPQHLVPTKRKWYLLRESLMLSYNLRFASTVRKSLRGRGVRALYQRHGRFAVVGALLSWWLRVPFILEYNGSETWVADYWDQARFRTLLDLCEEASLLRAHMIVVVSDALKQELLQREIPEHKVVINPNAVNPAVFHPDCGGLQVRDDLGLKTTHIMVGFVGTFSYWHGIEVLQHAIQLLLQDGETDPVLRRLRFVLVGEGSLYNETRHTLERDGGDRVLFTGLLPHQRIPAYLDAADILLSPHVPMPDGRPFFGSPTKIFEYMAMAKAIIASDLDQLSEMLQHRRSAWLVQPGNARELASAIVLLARDPELRYELGQNARASALSQHTWQQNASRVLSRLWESETQSFSEAPVAAAKL